MSAQTTAFVVSLASLAILAGVLGVRTGRWRASTTLVLGGAAFAALLQHLTYTGWNQRYPWVNTLFEPGDGLYALVILVDILWVGAAGLPWVRQALRGLRPPRALIRSALALVLFLAGAALLTPVIATGQYLLLALNFALGAFGMALGLANLLLFAQQLGDEPLAFETTVRGWFGEARDQLSPTGRRLAVYCALFALAISTGFAVVLFEGIPQIPDTVSMFWHARYFAAGQLYLPPPPVPEAFHQYLVVYDETKQYAHSSPMWPAVLAVGVFVHAPWLINPLIGAATVLVGHGLLERMHGLRAAQIGAVLLAASPWFLFMNGTYMIHPLSLLFAMLAMRAAWEAVANRSALWAALCGGQVGLLFTTRSFEGVIVGVFLGVWLLRRLGRSNILGLLGFGVAGLIPAVVNLAYNQALTGHWATLPTTTGVATEYDPTTNRLGFGDDLGFGWTMVDPYPGHTVLEALLNANHNLYWLQFETFGWPCGSLLIILLGLAIRRRFTGKDLFWGLYVLAVVGAYSLYWFSGGPDYGARYWYLVLPALVALTAAWTAEGLDLQAPASRRRLHRTIGAALLVGFVVVVPWRALDKYPRRRGMQPHLVKLERELGLDGALVFIRAKRSEDYASAFIRNPLDLEDAEGPIYVRSVDPETDRRVQESFPDRKVWVLASPQERGGVYSVVSRPR